LKIKLETQNLKQKIEKKTKQKKIEEEAYQTEAHQHSPSASPPRAQEAYRFALSLTGGTHLTVVIVSIFFLSSSCDQHDTDELHIDAVFPMTTTDICWSPPPRPDPLQSHWQVER
jgi:stress-induced morphogen